MKWLLTGGVVRRVVRTPLLTQANGPISHKCMRGECRDSLSQIGPQSHSWGFAWPSITLGKEELTGLLPAGFGWPRDAALGLSFTAPAWTPGQKSAG
jgi:hypothetical protein